VDASPNTAPGSFGALLRRYAIDAAPIKGVLNLPVSARKVASIALRKPANRNLAISLTAGQFRYGFGNALPEHESAELYDRWTVPSSGKPLFEAVLANFTPRSPAKVSTGNKTRAPFLLTAGQRSHRAGSHHDVEPRALPQVAGHHRRRRVPGSRPPLTVDHGWREVAQSVPDWLGQRSLQSA
jgi:non-heme chloroperoxidase